METELLTLPAFIEREGITLTYERVNAPNWIGVSNWGGGKRCKQCHARFTTKEQQAKLKWDHRTYKSGTCYLLCHACQNRVIEVEPAQFTVRLECGGRNLNTAFQMGNPLGEPDVCDVLHCLKSDAQAWLYADDLEDFVKELGFVDPDSDTPAADMQKAADAYIACAQTYKQLAHLLGSEAKRDELLNDVEGY